jgi:hypothetical protein
VEAGGHPGIRRVHGRSCAYSTDERPQAQRKYELCTTCLLPTPKLVVDHRVIHFGRWDSVRGAHYGQSAALTLAGQRPE